MVPKLAGDLSNLLVEWADGDELALAGLVSAVEEQLRSFVSDCISCENTDFMSQLTAAKLGEQAYDRLVKDKQVRPPSRVLFLALAAQIIRHILLEEVRGQHHIGRHAMISLDQPVTVSKDRLVHVVALDEAMKLLSEIDPGLSRLVELRLFGGLTTAEIVEHLEISVFTVRRRWRMARAWLYRALTEARDPP